MACYRPPATAPGHRHYKIGTVTPLPRPLVPVCGLSRHPRYTTPAGSTLRVHQDVDAWVGLSDYAESKYCLQVDGNAPWSQRLVQFIALGCVPVLFTDRLEPPFAGIFDWTKFSVRVPTDQIAGMVGMLAKADYPSLFRNLLAVRGYFRYGFDFEIGGLGWNTSLPLIVYEMWRRLENGKSAT